MTSRSCDRDVITGPALIPTLGPEAASCTAHRRQDYKGPSEACYHDFALLAGSSGMQSGTSAPKFPKGRLFNLSVPEHAAMRSYIKESLEKGHIRPSSSPLGAGFIFVAKKDGSLRPCIDYRLLNKITVKFQYPLPLLSDLFARIKGAGWFTKIDLRGAHNLVRIKQGDEWKTAFITPEGHFEYLVMPFGLSNAPSVFQSFMHDIFRKYLDRFMIVYLDDILVFSDDWESHVKQVEVDASEIGAGAVLSQRSSDGSVMKPCAFFSRKFSPAERNYDVGNRELLAMKWAFEEWRHWLEGAKHRVVEPSDCPGVDTVVDRLQQIWTHVVDNLTLSQEKAQCFANRRCCVGPRLRVGDLVWLSSRYVPMKVSSPKFKPRFMGPYKISEVLNPVSFRLALPASFAIHNVFHRSLLRRYVVPMVPSVDPPAPVLVEGELEYVVEKILDSRISRRKLQYLVKWKGYGQEDNSWVFASDVHAADLVRAFHMARPDRPGGSGAEVKPVVAFMPNWRIILLYESVTLSCNLGSKAQENPRYYWTKDSKLLSYHQQTIQIESSLEEDTGTYQCWTNRGFKSDPVRLDVVNSHLILQIPPVIYIGEPLTLRCHTFSTHQKTNTTFFKNKTAIHFSVNDNELRFTSVGLNVAGIYHCSQQIFIQKKYKMFNATMIVSVQEPERRHYSEEDVCYSYIDMNHISGGIPARNSERHEYSTVYSLITEDRQLKSPVCLWLPVTLLPVCGLQDVCGPPVASGNSATCFPHATPAYCTDAHVRTRTLDLER
ncbi:unnamed protein product [Ranitomeya imitator]|uniref:ribonuclease H n=1 Tax=Ranitomeya imitator TaxID=111125 RepID=A0ABN9LMJ4_9NEOB|nr:unnamed protein product [Ranitomeya imitator]